MERQAEERKYKGIIIHGRRKKFASEHKKSKRKMSDKKK